ncbi:MaoC family dehydratase [Paraliomyxa miuraensis]|uniref:MaoC family dehydratase n=1 Tax=Paraliomyxa miuraensis TaxID=376150 RepID=UPI00224DD0D0|nr:MaoC/PaaZ C-terminal domain-containing protein [Paraliomyxa miuraensis]MCX4246945.1 MaoC/PaaZ C-terminal domain-containing protein [Paraliomyxa miuraensis]
MAVSSKHVLQQGPVIATLASVAASAIRQQLDERLGRAPHGTTPQVPGPEITATIVPRPSELLRAYVRHVGGDPAAYRGQVPAHFFPQWGFPLASRTLQGLPYPLFKVLNGGCRLEINGPLPAGEALHARARLEGIDDDGRRAVIHQRVVTGTGAVPNAVVGHLYAVVPLGRGKGKKGEAAAARREPARVPGDAEELQRWRLSADAGLDFAKLTGDFNPVHWIAPYARAFGFRNTILHGFSTMARAMEGLQRTLFAGSVRALRVFDVKFTKPLTLPAKVGLYAKDTSLWVGDAPGGPAYLVGTFETNPLPKD